MAWRGPIEHLSACVGQAMTLVSISLGWVSSAHSPLPVTQQHAFGVGAWDPVTFVSIVLLIAASHFWPPGCRRGALPASILSVALRTE